MIASHLMASHQVYITSPHHSTSHIHHITTSHHITSHQVTAVPQLRFEHDNLMALDGDSTEI